MGIHYVVQPGPSYAKSILIGVAVSLFGGTLAFGQTAPYETRLYRPGSSTLEKNYGLPSFGMPGSELPKQRTMATPRTKPTDPDFLSTLGAQAKNGDDEDRLAPLRDGMETPDSTTPDTTDTRGTERRPTATPQ